MTLFDRGSDRDVLLLEVPVNGGLPISDTSPRLEPESTPDAFGSDELSGPLARARHLGWILIGLQLAGMLAFSTFQYSRFALTTDFGAYSQVWWKIAHGQINPWSSVFGTAFWKNDSEFAMWPLSLLSHAYPHPIVLLWVQDVVVAATEIAAFGWIIDVVRRSKGQIAVRQGSLLMLGAAVVMVVNPWVYETIAFDFHFETLAALFVVLAGRDLWLGRVRRLWWWVALALLSGVLGGLYLFGVGLSGMAAGRRTRRTGLLIGTIGIGWFVLFTSLGASGLGGRLIDSGYAYLVGAHRHVDLTNIVVGAFSHPGAVAHMVAQRWPVVFEFLIVVGLVGVVSPWGCGMAFVVFVPSILNSDPSFLRLVASFQSWPALPFVLVGSVMVIIRLILSNALARRVAVATVVASMTALVVLAGAALPAVARAWIAVDSRAAAQLAKSQQQIPAGAEVIASQGVVGRFANRQYVYPYPFQYHPLSTSSTTFPVTASPVVFVLTPAQGSGEAPAADTRTAIGFIEHRLGARVVDNDAGVYVLEWRPPRGATSITLP
jgi:uncharacterized membrane protein